MSEAVKCPAPVTPVISEVRGQPPVTPGQTRASLTSLGTPDKASPGLHPDILAVLSWQNEQLTALQVNSYHCHCNPQNRDFNVFQDQVARLLEASPASRSRASLGNSTRDAQTSVLGDPSPVTPERRDTGAGVCVSTNTSTRWPVTGDQK